MINLKYITYLIVSIIGGAIIAKIIPTTSPMINAVWLMTGNILYELLTWKYETLEENNEN